jgi:hypothetical protein
MNTDEFLIEKTIELFESNTGWGDSDEWSNQDFVILSEKIKERTGAALSHVTLKRVWGKVKYVSLPNTHTLDTLVQFLGYENWREFRSQNVNGNASAKTIEQIIINGHHIDNKNDPKKNKSILKTILFIAIPVALILTIVFVSGLLIAPLVMFGSADKVKPAIEQSNEKIVRAVYTAYEKKDWNMLRSLFADGFTFSSQGNDHIDIKAYKERCWPNAYNIKSFHIDKLIADGDDAFVRYHGWTMDGKEMQNTEYFKFKDGKIKENACFFGPDISFPNNTGK